MRNLLIGLVCFGSSLVAAAPYLSPQEAVKAMTMPAGFSVDLLAAEPDLVQPIAFCWDARGRIWVVEGNTYPTRAGKPPEGTTSQPNEAQLKDIFGGKDRILIFEDADHNGSFETRKVFVEGLNLVSGIELGYGGVYVGAAPYLLHIPIDAASDKPSGPPEILLDGWGYQDTHETLNSFIWGPDGWLYGCHGVFTHSAVGKPGTPAPERVKLNCAYWRYHPTRKTFDIYAQGTSNSWGFDYNEAGDWFSEACVIPHFWHIIQGGYYLRQSNPLGHFNPYVYTNIETIADHQHYQGNNPHGGNGVSDAAGGGHAHCGLCIYTGDNFPEEYRGRPMMFNIHGHRINQEILVREGSGYVAKHLPDFLKTNDPNFTGVALKVGPDGAVYFIDWYDKQKCHRTQPEDWDRSNGRLYRVKYDATWKPYSGKDLAKASAADLGVALASKNGWHARMAQHVATQRLTHSKDQDELADVLGGAGEYKQLRSFWLAQAIGSGDAAAYQKRILSAKPNDPSVPSLIRLVGEMLGAKVEDVKPLLAMCKISASARLALTSAIRQFPAAKRWEILSALTQYAEDATDHNLPQMIWYAAEPCVVADPEKSLKLASESKIPLVTQNIARRMAEMDGGLELLIRFVSQQSQPDTMRVFLKAATDGLKGKVGIAAPASWEKAFPAIEVVSNSAKAPDLLDLRLNLAMAFGDARAYPQLRAQALDTALPVDRRKGAFQTLVIGNDPELAKLVMQLLDDKQLRLDALKALPQATSRLPKSGK